MQFRIHRSTTPACTLAAIPLLAATAHSHRLSRIRPVQPLDRFFGAIVASAVAASAASSTNQFSTYLDSGGVLGQIQAMTVDSAGNAYVTGFAYHDAIAAVANFDVIVAKLSPKREMVHARILDLAKEDKGFSITVDETGNMCMTAPWSLSTSDSPLVLEPTGPRMFFRVEPEP